MTKNTLLNIAISISRILKALLIISALALTCLFVYVQIKNDAFANQEIKLIPESSYFDFSTSIGFSTIHSEIWGDANYDSKPYTIGKLKTLSLYVIYFKGIIFLSLIFMLINAFEKIMLSIKTLKTFSAGNSKLFRKIGMYIVFIVVITSYSVFRFENGLQTKVSIQSTPIIFALLAFIMAEIFKEGSV